MLMVGKAKLEIQGGDWRGAMGEKEGAPFREITIDWQLFFASERERERTKAAMRATFVESRAASHLSVCRRHSEATS
jgi:hypothetical protein